MKGRGKRTSHSHSRRPTTARWFYIAATVGEMNFTLREMRKCNPFTQKIKEKNKVSSQHGEAVYRCEGRVWVGDDLRKWKNKSDEPACYPPSFLFGKKGVV